MINNEANFVTNQDAANDFSIMDSAVLGFYHEDLDTFACHDPFSRINNESNIEQNFKFYVEKAVYLEEQKYHRNEITAQTLQMFYSRINAQLLPFFGNHRLKSINYEQIAKFVNLLMERNIKSITIKQYLGLLKRILKIGLNEGELVKLPLFPSIQSKSMPRGSFTCNEYKKLLRTAKLLEDPIPMMDNGYRATAKGAYKKRLGIPKEMRWLIQFMVNSFVRPVDIKVIKHKHIEIIHQGNTNYLRLNLPETKNHRGQIVTLSAAKRVYEILKRYQEMRGFGKPDDYLFIPESQDRLGAIQLISGHFRKILKSANLYFGQYGQSRSLYCLRHTAITFRLRFGHGIDLITLARNARTSVEMIEKFYSSELSAEMNIHMIQSRRPVKY